MKVEKIFYLIKNIFGFIFWFFLLNKWLFQLNIQCKIFEKIFFIFISHSFYILISIAILFAVLLLGLSKFKLENTLIFFLKIFLFFLYIILFPFIKIFSLISTFILKLITYDSVAVKHFLHLVFFVILLLLISAILTFNNSSIISISLIGLLIILLFYQSYLVYWFTDSNLLLKIPDLIIEKYHEEKIDRKDIFSKSLMLLIVKFLLNRRLWFLLFIITFLLGLFFITMAYSFIYYGLTKINEASFTILKANDYFKHLYFSISNFSTIDSGGIEPLTEYAKISVIMQIISAIFLFSILITSFSLITFQDTEIDSKTIIKKINSEIKKIKSSLNIKTDLKLFIYAFKKKNK